MWILVDDVRDLRADVICRNAEAAIKVLASLDFDGLLLDYDLGMGDSGHHVLAWALEAGRCPPQVQLVSMSASGVKHMGELLLRSGYSYDSTTSIYRR